MFGLFGRGRSERLGFEIYNRIVVAARDPYLYAELGVPDTLDGRFDLVGLYACMAIRRLQRTGPPGRRMSQAVFDAMFSDMDINLREMGVSDMAIAKKVRAMWEAFHGRAMAYDGPLASGDVAALTQAVARNVWRGDDRDSARLGAAAMAHLAMTQMRALERVDDSAILRGAIEFGSARAMAA